LIFPVALILLAITQFLLLLTISEPKQRSKLSQKYSGTKNITYPQFLTSTKNISHFLQTTVFALISFCCFCRLSIEDDFNSRRLIHLAQRTPIEESLFRARDCFLIFGFDCVCKRKLGFLLIFGRGLEGIG
jgi:hypothetical protein